MWRANGQRRRAGKATSVRLTSGFVFATAAMVMVRTGQAQTAGTTQASGKETVQARSAAPGIGAIRNPSFLHATELLGPAVPGVGHRVRFEWEPVLGCTQYVLTGQWTDGRSWALHSSEYRVTTRNASTWQARRVTFDVSLPAGNHSWKLVAVFGPNDAGDFESPAQLSFDVK